jgi:hypothetical protein
LAKSLGRDESQKEQTSRKPRAQRYPIRTSVRYRASGEPEWSRGDTLNISRSGVLFEAGDPVKPATLLEMHILFPSEITGDAPASVICWGPVVRADGSSLAAAILKYRFARE